MVWTLTADEYMRSGILECGYAYTGTFGFGTRNGGCGDMGAEITVE